GCHVEIGRRRDTRATRPGYAFGREAKRKTQSHVGEVTIAVPPRRSHARFIGQTDRALPPPYSCILGDAAMIGQRPCRTLAEDPGRTQPRAAYPRRCSSNASGLPGRNSARILGIRASSAGVARASIPAEILAYARAAYPQRRSSNANSLCGQNSAGFPGNLCDLSKGCFATTFLSSSPVCPATQSGLCRPCQVCSSQRKFGKITLTDDTSGWAYWGFSVRQPRWPRAIGKATFGKATSGTPYSPSSSGWSREGCHTQGNVYRRRLEGRCCTSGQRFGKGMKGIKNP